MNEYRRQILEMLANGKITAEEADRLMGAFERERGSNSTGPTPQAEPKPKAKYLRIQVEAEEGKEGDGPTKVNVRVPMQFLRAGVRVANFMPKAAWDRVNHAMRDKGVDFDLNQLKPENLEDLIDQLNDLSVDVDHKEKDNNVRVKIFCE